MYAIIETGGKQYQVRKGDVLDVELLGKEIHSEVSFDEVILFVNGEERKVGLPHVKGCSVKAEILEEVRGPKVLTLKYKRRKRSRRKVGHRQDYSRVKIMDIKQA